MEDKKLHLFWRKEDEISHEDHLFDVFLVNVLGRASEGGDCFLGEAQRRDLEVNGPVVPSPRLKGMMELQGHWLQGWCLEGDYWTLDTACVPEQPL